MEIKSIGFAEFNHFFWVVRLVSGNTNCVNTETLPATCVTLQAGAFNKYEICPWCSGVSGPFGVFCPTCVPHHLRFHAWFLSQDRGGSISARSRAITAVARRVIL